jgi:FKBP-type peptidyl-prolyl cis-trans isomerase FkpA
MRIRNLTFAYVLTICVFLVTSCNRTSEYPGYNKSESTFFYKLIKIGDDNPKCRYNDYITASICYKTLNDSIFFNGKRKFQISKPDFQGAIDECLTMLAKDDSASFIISASDFFRKTLSSDLPSFFKETDKMKVDIVITDIQTPEEYNREKEAFLKWIEDFGEYEKTVLKQYLEGSKLKVKPLSSGMMYLVLKKGNNKGVKTGDTITVHYEGKFLNGKFFDSTRQRKEAFQFVYGQQWQVIKGMEEAIGLMHEGEKALFIMPSELAFGETGSSTGIIPPFTSLIFEIELVSIK